MQTYLTAVFRAIHQLSWIGDRGARVAIAGLGGLAFICLTAVAAERNVIIAVSEQTMTALKSPWADYFGTHYANASDEGAGTAWNTVRDYGRQRGAFPGESKDAPPLKGPFTGKEVRLTLSEAWIPQPPPGAGPRRAALPGRETPEQMLQEIIRAKLTAICLLSNVIRPTTAEPFDRDRAYWTVRLIHEKFPEAHRHLVWQIGNEVVSGHFDPKGVWRKMSQQERQPQGMKEDNFFGYDLKWKEEFYANEYLAPAIEAIERASRDVYGDPRRIRIALGSMNPYNRPNLVFLKNVMARTFDGRHAPTLKDEPVTKHIDLLTVHYMTGSRANIATLQQYHDDYLKTGKIQGIWVTEDHGRAGRGPVTILDRGMRFLAWVARNNLDAEQTRLCWWGETERDPGGQGREATLLLGAFFAGRRLHFASQTIEGGTIYTLSDGTNARVQRVLVALVPEPGRSFKLDTLRLELPRSDAPRQWGGEAIQYSSIAPGKKLAVTIDADPNGLAVRWERDVPEPALLMLKARP